MFVADSHGRVTLSPADSRRDRLAASEAVTEVLQLRAVRGRRRAWSQAAQEIAGGILFFILLAATLVLWFGGSN